jgi:CYTH domain-containing protein
MAMEVERKFLVINDKFKNDSEAILLRQGYLCIDSERTVRVRRYNEKGFITIKSKTESCSREEFEYSIPVQDANRMLDNLCIKPIIEKVRYFLTYKGNKWIVDEFLGVNKGLVVAEIELENEQQTFERPDWIGTEITADIRYFNSRLTEKPYQGW